MYRTRYGRLSRRPRRKYIRRARKGSKKPSKFLKKTIQTMISKNVEDKTAFFSTGTSLTYCNSGINAQGDCQQVIPAINSGSTEQHRIGDTIRGKTLVIRGYLQLQKDQTFGDVANKRIGVRLMVVGSKRVRDWTQFAGNFATGSQYLLQRGNQSLGFSGYINDLWTPVNREEYVVYYDKVHYLNQSYVATQVGSSSPTVAWSQDISKGIKFFTIRIPLRGKKLLYDSVSGTDFPTNWSCGLCMGYAHLDGSAPDTISTAVGISYDSVMTYEDA